MDGHCWKGMGDLGVRYHLCVLCVDQVVYKARGTVTDSSSFSYFLRLLSLRSPNLRQVILLNWSRLKFLILYSLRAEALQYSLIYYGGRPEGPLLARYVLSMNFP